MCGNGQNLHAATYLAVRPSQQAVSPAHFLEDSRTHAKLLACAVYWQMKMKCYLCIGDVAFITTLGQAGLQIQPT